MINDIYSLFIEKQNMIDLKVITGIIVFLIIGGVTSDIYSNRVNNAKANEPTFPTIAISRAPSNTPTPTKAPTTIRIEKSNIVPTVDPDPIINCLIHASCGGGSRQLRKSACDQTICCQIGESWIFYESSSKCDQDQDAYYNQNKYVAPTFAPLPTWAPLPTYAPFPTYPPFEPYDEWEKNNPEEPQPIDTKAYEDCMRDARDTYSAAIQRSKSYGAGTQGAMQQIAQQDFDRDTSSCNQYSH